MKKILLTICAALSINAVSAQCNELIISKYFRFKGNTKAMEFYNPTNQPINLTSGLYSIERYKSAGTPGVLDAVLDDSLYLVGTVPAYGTWVLVNGQTAANSTTNSPQPDSSLQALANQLDKQYGTNGTNVGQPMYFKGNDCLVLRKNGVIIDVFGEVNCTVTTAWSTIAPYRGASGMGKWITTGYMMERKASIKSGRVPASPSDLTTFTEFNPLAEFDTIPKIPAIPAPTRQDTLDLYSLFGSHACDCSSEASINEVDEQINALVYPNPSNGNVLITAKNNISTIEVYNFKGEIVKSEKGIGNNFLLNTEDLISGIYLVKTHTKNGKIHTNKLVFN